jgi:hypothetical protein
MSDAAPVIDATSVLLKELIPAVLGILLARVSSAVYIVGANGRAER